MSREETVFDRLLDFMNDYDIDCTDDLYNKMDSTDEACVDLVAKLVNIVLEGE